MTITTLYDVALNTNDVGYGSTGCIRGIIEMPAANALKDQIRFTLAGPAASGQLCGVAHLSVGLWDDAYDIANTLVFSATAIPTPVPFGGNVAVNLNNVTNGVSVEAVSDWISFSGTLVFGTTYGIYGLVVVVNFSGDARIRTPANVAPSGGIRGTLSDTTSWQTRAGFPVGSANSIAFVRKIEVQDVGGGGGGGNLIGGKLLGKRY